MQQSLVHKRSQSGARTDGNELLLNSQFEGHTRGSVKGNKKRVS